MTLNSRELRRLDDAASVDIKDARKRRPLYIILEDVLDTYNIGGFFRLADAVGAAKIYLCGGCATPPDPKIMKASVGTYRLVPWEYAADAAIVIAELKKYSRLSVIAVEQSQMSVDYRDVPYDTPLAFLFGNETAGLSDATLQLADKIAEVPMYGFNKSLNVMVAAGIVIYRSLENRPRCRAVASF